MTKWKDVFWAFALLFAVQLGTTPFSTAGTLWDVARLITGGLSLIPLYGYAYQLAIGNKALAIIIFGCNAISLVVVALFAVYGLVSDWALLTLWLVFLLLALSFVFLYPQYKYAFDSDELWAGSA